MLVLDQGYTPKPTNTVGTVADEAVFRITGLDGLFIKIANTHDLGTRRADGSYKQFKFPLKHTLVLNLCSHRIQIVATASKCRVAEVVLIENPSDELLREAGE